MSKKKATMTLKDFHGGSIPSDLSLPSAPGVNVRPVDRSGFDRQSSWGNSVGRSDHRLRPASAGSAMNLDEKTPFLSHSSLGRNFDEDERKPLDGVSGPRRTVADESFHAQPGRIVEPKINNISGARVGSSASISFNQISSGSTGSSHAGRVVDVHNPKLNRQAFSGGRSYVSNYPIMGSNTGQSVVGSYPNAWGIRKETASSKEPEPSTWSAPDAETKLAHASALEKVSSGRWNSKQVPHPKDAAAFGRPETEVEFDYNANNVYSKNTYNRLDVANDTGYQDRMVMHSERSLAAADGIHCSGKETPPAYERAKSTIHVELYERNTSATVNGFRLLHPAAKPDGTEFQSALPSESSERPKLKLLPRSKPLENSGPQISHKQRYEQSGNHLHLEDSYAVHDAKNPVQSGITGFAVGDQAPERPRLNLKPRSQLVEQLEGNSERGTLNTEAHPREMVPKADTFMHVPSACVAEKSESIPTDQRIAKYSNKRDHQLDGEKTDTHRRDRQNDNWRSNRDAEKHRNQQQKDRPPSPETWCKPIEQAKPASPDAATRFGKAASAVELAQAFSNSASDPVAADRLSGPRGVPSRTQVPFSRLMGPPTPRPQINGY